MARVITHNRVTYTFDIDQLEIKADLDTEMNVNASMYGRALDLLVSIQYARDVNEAGYRAWRASLAEKTAAERPSEKISEARQKNIIEADPQFADWKRKQAGFARDVAFLEGWLKAVELKGRMLSARRRVEESGEGIAGGISAGESFAGVDEDKGSMARARIRAARRGNQGD